ncbi:uncharacterized protein EAF01_007210 [Botrytis porri]|nr:uncharacterized protein EAF01_007210 [Botrytis porri]KAF7901912.1 hypothetical protein EAF01_007210 [Botrytis porri]
MPLQLGIEDRAGTQTRERGYLFWDLDGKYNVTKTSTDGNRSSLL